MQAEIIDIPKTNPEKVFSIILAAYEGRVVIPEFQRSFLWRREDVEELLASVLKGYFIGTFLMLDTSSTDPIFAYRALEGLEQVNPQLNSQRYATVRLVLDGQQRITSLVYVLYQPNVALSGAVYPYHFFLRLDLALEGAIDEAVVGVSLRDNRRTSEMQRLVQAERAIPFSLFRDPGQFYDWLYRHQAAWQDKDQKDLIA